MLGRGLADSCLTSQVGRATSSKSAHRMEREDGLSYLGLWVLRDKVNRLQSGIQNEIPVSIDTKIIGAETPCQLFL